MNRRSLHKLTDRDFRVFAENAPALSKLFDGGGLHLFKSAAGSTLWRYKYLLPGGIERLFSIGPYPEISLQQAREVHLAARELLRKGQDPVGDRRERLKQKDAHQHLARPGITFREVAREWLAKKTPGWSAVHAKKSTRAIERDLYPTLGDRAIHSIDGRAIAAAIKSIAKRGAVETSGRVLQHLQDIFKFAQGNHYCEHNPCEHVAAILPDRTNRNDAPGRRPAMLTWPELGAILRDAELAHLSPAVRMAHRLCAFTAARNGNIVQAEWPEMQLEDTPPAWVIPRAKMKARNRDKPFTIILGPTIAAELRAWRERTGGKGYVFPSPADSEKSITREALEKVYRVTLGLGDRHTPHGWRAAFSTLAREDGDFDGEIIDLSLDHVIGSDVGRAYDRSVRLEKREKLMSWWDAQLVRAQAEAFARARKEAAATKA